MKTGISQVLDDRTSTGKKRDWALHKLHNSYMAMAYDQVDLGKAKRMRECANWLSFHKDESGKMILHDARFCRVRLCPICQWRRALKTYIQMSQILEQASNEGYQFLFLTLTLKNCEGIELSNTLNRIAEAFNRLMKYKEVASAVKGYYRGCEVTHNIETNEYHPHLHCILAVRSGYFGGTMYISQARWAYLWQKALKADYEPIVDIRKCKGGAKAVAEACKYSVKPSDILNMEDWDMTVETLRVLDGALDHRRFIGLGGIFREIHRKLHLDDMEDGDLIGFDETNTQGSAEEITYFWNGYSQYTLST